MNLWKYLKPKDNNSLQLDISSSIQPIQNNQAFNNMLFDKIANNNIKENNALQVGFNKLKNNINLFDKIYQATPDSNSITTNENGEPVLNSRIGNPQIKPGFFSDAARGFNENYNNGFQLNNWKADSNKGIGTRIGEAMGSIGRFIQSPLGRSAIVGGLVGLTGGNPLDMLTYGAQTGVLNQQNRMKDNLYRTNLNNQGIDTSNINGYIGDETFKQLLNAKQLQDNAEYRKMYYDTMKQNHADSVNLAREKFDFDKQQQAIDNYYKKLGYDQKERSLDLQDKKIDASLNAKQNADDLGDIQQQLDNFANTFETVNNPYRYRAFGWQNALFNNQTKDEANFNAQRTLLFNQIARKLGGEKGVLSDKDIERVDAALPKLSDTLTQKKAKMKAVYDLLNIKKGSNYNFIQGLNDNPLGLDL